MVVEEEVFNKEVDKVVKKPKRKLTEKQLENLAKGRARMAEKRRLAKEKAEQKAKEKDDKKTAKESEKVAVEGQKAKHKAHKQKRRTLKEINAEKEAQILARLQKEDEEKTNKKNARLDLFTSLKVKCLEKAKSVSEYNEIKQALDGIDEDTLHNDAKLKEYAKNVMKPYIKKKEVKTDNENKEKE